MLSPKLKIDPESLLGDFARQDEATELRFIASGMSMYPFVIGGRDTVTLRRQTQVRRLDIVAAHIPEGGYVLHRVYDVCGERLTLMGDHNLRITEICETGDVIGVVTHINGRECNAPLLRALSRLWINLRFMRRYLIWIIKKTDSRL